MLQQAIKTVRTFLPQTGSVSRAEIDTAVDMALSLPLYSSVDKDALLREIESIYNVRIEDFRVIEDTERRLPWINAKKAGIDFKFWNRYRDYLQYEKNFADTVLNQLDRLTDRTLDGLFDPEINAIISKYGLVVGQVQSGKTANYTGLICKGADAGFNLIIVLAGIHNNLRSQTQLRIDEGFLGFDTQHERAFRENNTWIGVGRFNQNAIAHSLTTSISDFNTAAANSSGINFGMKDPLVLVVKKNATILNRLLQWLNSKAIDVDGRRVIRSKSLLLIDDEADNASINTNRDNDPATRINDLIRNILRLFDKSGYVGYTATPFANIFIPIEEDNLFPRDFIINLPAPSNYIGPDKVFGFRLVGDDEESDDVLPIVRRIDDHHHFVDDSNTPTEVPESLKTAIKCFIITCAIRRLRGQTDVHNSMLVHVSRLRAWQHELKSLVENVFDFYRRGIEMKIASVLEEFREVFEEDQGNYKSYTTISSQILNSQLAAIDGQIQIHTWEDVKQHPHEAASRIIVKEINMGSADALNYYDHPNGLSVIAVGGNKLSRGLTLEGLSVSYYLRTSRMYDSLMQMGRWFGYRPGYVDLCRLFTSRQLNEWFCHITHASEELRNEFDYMSDTVGATPEQYALKVRTHPGVLQISASNKIRRATTVTVSWAGRLVESYEFQKKADVISSNLQATIAFIDQLNGRPEIRKDNYLWFDVNVENIKSLLQGFRLSENLKRADPTNLIRFINLQVANNELTEWRVAIMSKKKADLRYTIQKGEDELDIGLFNRRQDERNSSTDNYYIKRSHIISPGDEVIDLTDEERNNAWNRTIEYWRQRGKEGEPSYISGEIVRNEIRDPRKPLLLIYFLNPEEAGLASDSNPIVGYAISFPSSRFNATVSYAVHEQLLSIFNQEDNLEEEDEDED
ncbi:endonuclease [Terrimonas sp.]|uniref:Z1 domain-containing protein n=1 Tax=Terrimonas sp. TaxID=1914338 RepID=UPI000D50D840|nr:Z1 domain-containing protein [Terrimonas sp.]PVD53592.1 endonuclease [Terrimonas sp.]